ncbi:hypothetical protein DOY81_010095 [Sarcophaga bullata]|nr:hypothetical protein DOY81_010095 [Sarcophaga bullata]
MRQRIITVAPTPPFKTPSGTDLGQFCIMLSSTVLNNSDGNTQTQQTHFLTDTAQPSDCTTE